MTHSNPMTDEKKEIIWKNWRAGFPMSRIAKEVNKPPATIFSYLQYHGGMEPRRRYRSFKTPGLTEREDISRGLAAGESMRSIASMLGRCPSTISREINKNGGVLRYRAVDADRADWIRAKRPKQPVLSKNHQLKRLVESKLALKWSPEQISGWLKIQFPEDAKMQVSHETIYRSLFIQTRGIFKEELRKHLRTKRKFRHSKQQKAGSRGKIVDGISISERPASVEDRAIPGH